MLKIIFFAKIKENLCRDFIEIEIETPCSVSDVRNYLKNEFSDHHHLFSEDYATCAINHEISNEKNMIRKGDEVAFFPPVTGG